MLEAQRSRPGADARTRSGSGGWRRRSPTSTGISASTPPTAVPAAGGGIDADVVPLINSGNKIQRDQAVSRAHRARASPRPRTSSRSSSAATGSAERSARRAWPRPAGRRGGGRLPPWRTVSGPPNGWRSVSREVTPGTIPRSDRYRSIAGSASETRTKRDRLADLDVVERARLPLGQVEVGGPGSGRRAGRTRGCRAWRRSARRARPRARARAARPRGGRRSHGTSSMLDEQQLQQAVVAQRPQRDAAALGGQRARRGSARARAGRARRAGAACPDTEPGVTPSRSASAFVGTGPSSRVSSA